MFVFSVIDNTGMVQVVKSLPSEAPFTAMD